MSERENYQLDTAEPKFYKSYDFNVDFPGAPVVYIEAWDYDGFFGDDHIGTTTIDLDDRFYNKEWSSMVRKPIEYRNLKVQSSSVSQGVIKMWCQIFEMASKKSNEPAFDITPDPSVEFEGRLVIWKTKDIEMMDFEGTSDIFCRTYLEDASNDHLTDTHWRCSTGEGSFNWRILFKILSRQDSYKLSIQAWDKDIIASNDLIGDFNLDIAPLVEDAILTNKTQVMCQQYWKTYMKEELDKREYEFTKDIEWESSGDSEEKFWIPVRRFVAEEKDDNGKVVQKEEIKYAGKI